MNPHQNKIAFSIDTFLLDHRKIITFIAVVSFLISSQPYSVSATGAPSVDDIQSFHWTAIELKNMGKYDEAEELFKTILSTAPQDVNAHFDLANTYLAHGKYDLAIAHFQQFERLEDVHDQADFFFNLSMCYVGLGNNDQAIKLLKKCLAVDSDFPSARELLKMVEDAAATGTKLVLEDVRTRHF